MKRVILAAVFIVAISGFAAAQSTSAKPATKKGQPTSVKKSSAVKSSNTVLKEETSANAKSDSTTVKLFLPVPKISDTTAAALPKVKNEEF